MPGPSTLYLVKYLVVRHCIKFPFIGTCRGLYARSYLPWAFHRWRPTSPRPCLDPRSDIPFPQREKKKREKKKTFSHRSQMPVRNGKILGEELLAHGPRHLIGPVVSSSESSRRRGCLGPRSEDCIPSAENLLSPPRSAAGSRWQNLPLENSAPTALGIS